MKKLLTFILVFLSFWAMSQTSPVLNVRVADLTTAFGQNLPIGSKVTVVSDSTKWNVKTAILGTATVTSAASSLYPDVITVKGTAPITSTGTNGKVVIAIDAATTTTAGSLSAADKVKIDNARVVQNHDSLSTLDEKLHASLTSVLGTGSYHLSQSQRDTILTAEQHADTTRNQGHATIFDLLSKRNLNNHDSLSTLDERKYQSLTDTLTWGLGLSQTGHVTKVDTASASMLSRQRAANTYQPLLTNPVTGTGTTNYIPKFTSATTIGNSMIYDDGTNVGIGTTAPRSPLEIVGEMDMTNSSVWGGRWKIGPSNSNQDFNLGYWNTTAWLDDVPNMTMNYLGNVGIRTTNPDGLMELNLGTNKQFRLSYDDADGSAANYAKMEVSSAGALTVTTVDGSAALGHIALMPDGGVSVKNNDPGAYALKVTGSIRATDSISAPTINLRTGATVGYVWKCTNVASGAGAWTAISASQFYNGAWDAYTNTPTLADGTGTQGTYYHCTVSGTVDFDGAGGRAAIAFTQYIDDVAYNGAIWEKIPNAQYSLLTMSSTVLGGAKLGTGLAVASDVLSVQYGTSSTTAAVGNDARLSDARVSNIAAGTSGNVMTSNGSVWTSATPAAYPIYFSERFEIPAFGATGSTVTLSYTPKNNTGVTVSQNGTELIYTTQFTVSGTTVTFQYPVYQYDNVVCSYNH